MREIFTLKRLLLPLFLLLSFLGKGEVILSGDFTNGKVPDESWTYNAESSSDLYLTLFKDQSLLFPSVDFSKYKNIEISIKTGTCYGKNSQKLILLNGTKELITSDALTQTTLTISSALELTTEAQLSISTASTTASVGVRIYKIEITGDLKPEIPNPFFSLAAGQYDMPINLSLSSETSGAEIYYTLDGTDPDSNSLLYSSEFSILETTTVKAICIYGDKKSQIVTSKYIIGLEPLICTIESTSSVSLDMGEMTVPDCIKATFKNTYSTKNQLTKGNTMTFTLIGYPYKLEKVVLNMKTNSSSGAGNIVIKVGDTVFNEGTYKDLCGACSSSYKDYTIGGVQNLTGDIVITISATTNSLYCNSFTIYSKTTQIISTSGDYDEPYSVDYLRQLPDADYNDKYILGVVTSAAESKISIDNGMSLTSDVMSEDLWKIWYDESAIRKNVKINADFIKDNTDIAFDIKNIILVDENKTICDNVNVGSYDFSKPECIYSGVYCEDLKSKLQAEAAGMKSLDFSTAAFSEDNLLAVLDNAGFENLRSVYLHEEPSVMMGVIRNDNSQVPLASAFRGLNPNCFFLIDKLSSESADTTGIANLLLNTASGYKSSHISLTDAMPYSLPVDVNGTVVTYIRDFADLESGTSKTGAKGWRAVTFPFSETEGALTIKAVNKSGQTVSIRPFDSNGGIVDGTKPFWLRKFVSGNYIFENASSINKNIPYIMSLPNNDGYNDAYRLSGEVSFTFEGNLLKTAALSAVEGVSFNMSVTYDGVASASTVYAMDELGSEFVKESRDIAPFESYIVIPEVSAASAPRAFSVDYTPVISGISEQIMKADTKNETIVYAENGLLYIYMDKAMNVDVYSIDGRKVSSVELTEGLTTLPLNKGVYLVNGKKVIM